MIVRNTSLWKTRLNSNHPPDSVAPVEFKWGCKFIRIDGSAPKGHKVCWYNGTWIGWSVFVSPIFKRRTQRHFARNKP
jgi:hypothetical protein